MLQRGSSATPAFKKQVGREVCEIAEQGPTKAGKAAGESGGMKAKETGNLKKERWEDSKMRPKTSSLDLVVASIAQAGSMGSGGDAGF